MIDSEMLTVLAICCGGQGSLVLQEHDAHVTQMSEEERQQLLRDLKTKWATVNTAYQKLPFSLDTPAKMKRKETFEKQLTEIEKDVRLLEHGSTVLVLQD